MDDGGDAMAGSDDGAMVGDDGASDANGDTANGDGGELPLLGEIVTGGDVTGEDGADVCWSNVA